MSFEEFKFSLSSDGPPDGLSEPLRALWHDAKGKWDAAHSIVQKYYDMPNMWVHAYLHREEGVLWNADYWYSRAEKARPDVSFEAEWEQIVTALLKDE